MASRVVSISRTIGAGGEEVARHLAEALGFRCVDDEIINKAAEAAGVDPETVEQAEHPRSVIARVLESLAATQGVLDPSMGYVAMGSAETRVPYNRLIEQVIRETAREGNVVIVAHGASIPLAGAPGLMRVLVTASPAVRVARLASTGVAEEKQCKRLVDESDRARHQYLQQFYDVGHEMPTHYDLVINTDILSVPKAAEIIAAAARG